MNDILKRNGRLDFYKFLFALVVMFVHYRWTPTFFTVGDHSIKGFPSGMLSVVFFFIVSGALFSISCFKKKSFWKSDLDSVANDTKTFLINKYLKLIDWYLISLALYALNDTLFGDGIKKTIERLFYTIPSMLLLGHTGFDNQHVYMGGYYVGASWYISALMIMFIILFPLMRINYNFFTKVISPIIFIGCLYLNLTSFKDHLLASKVYAILPFIFGIIIGDVACELNSRNLEFIKKYIWLIGALEFCCYCVTFLYICIDTTEMPFSDYPMMFIVGFGVFLTCINRTHVKIWDRKQMFALGDISHVLYMTHIPFMLLLSGVLSKAGLEIGKDIHPLFVAFAAVIIAYCGVSIERWLRGRKTAKTSSNSAT